MLPPPISLDQLTGPPLGFRFAVFFFVGGVVPNQLDIRFRRVSGLNISVSTHTVNEGGQNLYTHKLPQRVQYETLTLERGFVVGSPLNVELNIALSTFKFTPSNVLVALLGEDGVPLAAWLFMKAFPIRWATADLDASNEQILIDTIELAYASMQPMRI